MRIRVGGRIFLLLTQRYVEQKYRIYNKYIDFASRGVYNVFIKSISEMLWILKKLEKDFIFSELAI